MRKNYSEWSDSPWLRGQLMQSCKTDFSLMLKQTGSSPPLRIAPMATRTSSSIQVQVSRVFQISAGLDSPEFQLELLSLKSIPQGELLVMQLIGLASITQVVMKPELYKVIERQFRQTSWRLKLRKDTLIGSLVNANCRKKVLSRTTSLMH